MPHVLIRVLGPILEANYSNQYMKYITRTSTWIILTESVRGTISNEPVRETISNEPVCGQYQTNQYVGSYYLNQYAVRYNRTSEWFNSFEPHYGSRIDAPKLVHLC